MNIHEKYIKRCIELAKNGLGNTYPNPLVGSVIVYQDKIIGEGWHKRAGEPHAEVNAINSVRNRNLLKKATIYVSLEPCSHFGKTPPCSDLIISSGIKNVVVGAIDPFVEVAGRGIKKMIEAGCNVTVGVLDEECQALNKRFFTFHNKKRPYIILKWAESADGYVSPVKKNIKEPVWLTNQYSRQLVHKWRSEEQAILVGTNTVLDDNPKLNTRDWKGLSPVRVVIDKNLKTYPDHCIWDGHVKTFIITDLSSEDKNLSDNIILQKVDFQKPVIHEICKILFQEGLQSIIIEGGSKTLQNFIDENLWDEIRKFKSKVVLNEGTPAPVTGATIISAEKILTDNLFYYYNND